MNKNMANKTRPIYVKKLGQSFKSFGNDILLELGFEYILWARKSSCNFMEHLTRFFHCAVMIT
jgi:hypothetical protein